MKKIIFFTILLFGATTMFAQDLSVFFVKGVAYSLSPAGDKQLLKAGQPFCEKCTLLLEKGEVMLFDKNGNNTRITKAGKYGWKQLSELIKPQGNLLMKFFSLLWDDVAGSKKTAGDEDANLTGGVSKGAQDLFLSLPPDSFTVISDTLTFELRQSGKIELHIFDENDQQVFKGVYEGKVIKAPVAEMELQENYWYACIIEPDGGGYRYLRIADITKKQIVFSEIAALKEEIKTYPAELSADILKAYFLKKKMM